MVQGQRGVQMGEYRLVELRAVVAEHEMRSVRDVVEAGGEVRRALFQQQPLTQIRPESAHVAQFQPIVRGGAHVDAQAAVGGGWLRCHVVASLLL